MNLRMYEDVKHKMEATAAVIGTTSTDTMSIFARWFVVAGHTEGIATARMSRS